MSKTYLNETQEWEDYSKFKEQAKKLKCITIEVDSARYMAKCIRDREHLDIVSDTLDGLCDIVGEPS